jgi:hypothetical protein
MVLKYCVSYVLDPSGQTQNTKRALVKIVMKL